MTTQSSLLAWRIPIDGAWGHKESDRTDPLSTAQCAHARAHTHAHTHTHTHTENTAKCTTGLHKKIR